MRRIALALLTLALGLAVTGGALAAEANVPKVTHLRASPKKFCAQETSTCHHDGTHLRFTVSTNAKVRIDIRERRALTGSLIVFDKKLKKGANDVYVSGKINGKRLHTGKWSFRVQGTNGVGSGPIDTVAVQIVKHD